MKTFPTRISFLFSILLHNNFYIEIITGKTLATLFNEIGMDVCYIY